MKIRFQIKTPAVFINHTAQPRASDQQFIKAARSKDERFEDRKQSRIQVTSRSQVFAPFDLCDPVVRQKTNYAQLYSQKITTIKLIKKCGIKIDFHVFQLALQHDNSRTLCKKKGCVYSNYIHYRNDCIVKKIRCVLSPRSRCNNNQSRMRIK